MPHRGYPETEKVKSKSFIKKNKTMKKVIGYKVTDKNLQCRGFQFSPNAKFTHDGTPKLCENGFHFCEKINHCFNYYSFDSSNRILEVIQVGETDSSEDKKCTCAITFGNEISWNDMLLIANVGYNNNGHSNTGDSNTGDWNTGDWNFTNNSSGFFNTTEKFYVFDIECPIERKSIHFPNWLYFETKVYVEIENMTDAEKAKFPKSKFIYRDLDIKKQALKAWINADKSDRDLTFKLPNFEINGAKFMLERFSIDVEKDYWG